MSGECDRLGSVLSQQRFQATDIKALGESQLSDSLCYSSRTDQFDLKNEGKYILEVWGHADPEDAKRRERKGENTHVGERETPGPLAPLFICFFLPLGLPYVNWASQECSLFYLRSSLQSSDLPLFYFRRLFPCLLATAILDFYILKLMSIELVMPAGP